MVMMIGESVEMALNDMKCQMPSFFFNKVDIKLNMCFEAISNSLHNIFMYLIRQTEYFNKYIMYF